MRKILTITWKDVNVLFRDWAAVILIIAGPLALTIGMGLVTGSFNRSQGAPTISRIPVAVVNQDGGQFGEALVELLTGEELNELIEAEVLTDESAALALVEGGETVAAVIIPASFSDSFLPDATTSKAPEPVAVRVYGDPGSPIRAGIVRSIVDEFAGRAQSGVTTIQVSLSALARSGAATPADLPAVGQALGEQLFGGGSESLTAASLIHIDRESATPAGSPDFNPLAYFAPAMALLFLMYAVTLGARTLLSERREGTLARMLATPTTPAQVLGGKVGGIFLGGFIQLGALIVLTTLMFQLDWGNPLGVLLLVIAAAAAATGWGLLIASFASNSGQITNLGMALTLIFGILGGSFAPMQDAWPALDTLSRLTPNRWALDGFTALAEGGGLAAVTIPVLALALMAAALFALSAVVFRRRRTALLTA